MKLIIVSGATATGKTSIAKEIADTLGYTLYSKDAIKEDLFDSQHNSSHGYFWYERQARDIFYGAIEKSIAKNTPIIIENNFIKADKRRLGALISKDVQVAEIYCIASGFSRLKRFVNRGEGANRHKAHRDRRWYPSVFTGALFNYVGIRWPYCPVTDSDKILKVDTTNFSTVQISKILEFAKQD